MKSISFSSNWGDSNAPRPASPSPDLDILVRGIDEIVGRSQREERLEVLEENMRRHKMDPADYKWYFHLRRCGTVPHAGFWLGFERMLMFVTGVSNIRDVIPFARTPGSAEF